MRIPSVLQRVQHTLDTLPRGGGKRTAVRIVGVPLALGSIPISVGSANLEKIAEQRHIQNLSRQGALVKEVRASTVDFENLKESLPANLDFDRGRPYFEQGIMNMNPETFKQQKLADEITLTPLDEEDYFLKDFKIIVNGGERDLGDFCTQNKLSLNGGKENIPWIICSPKGLTGIQEATEKPQIIGVSIAGGNGTYLNTLIPQITMIQKAMEEEASIQLGGMTISGNGFANARYTKTLQDGTVAGVYDSALNVSDFRDSLTGQVESLANYTSTFSPETSMLAHTVSTPSMSAIEVLWENALDQPDRKWAVVSNSTFTGLSQLFVPLEYFSINSLTRLAAPVQHITRNTWSRLVGLPASSVGAGQPFEATNSINPAQIEYSAYADQTDAGPEGIFDTEKNTETLINKKNRTSQSPDGTYFVPQIAAAADLLVPDQKSGDPIAELPKRFTDDLWQQREDLLESLEDQDEPENFYSKIIHQKYDRVADVYGAMQVANAIGTDTIIKGNEKEHNPIFDTTTNLKKFMIEPIEEQIEELIQRI